MRTMTMEGRPACTRVGIRQAQEDVRFLVILAVCFGTLDVDHYLLDPYVVHPARIFPSHQKLLYLNMLVEDYRSR